MLRLFIVLLVLLATASTSLAVCAGDCSGDETVSINELLSGVNIALGSAAIDLCPAFDSDGDGAVTVSELLAAVNVLLNGCGPPAPTATSTATPTVTPTETPSNLPPTTATPFIYRGFAGQPIALPLGVSDPEGGPLECQAEGLADGMTLDADNVLRWTPADDQLGPLEVGFSCVDSGTPPAEVEGSLTLHVAAADSCAIPTCDAASGCSLALPSVEEPCCSAAPIARVAEVSPDCPLGRVLEIGRNVDGFGTLYDCDRLRIRNFAQSDAELAIHVRASCINTLNRVTIAVRLETKQPRGLAVNAEAQVFLPTVPTNGYFERRNVRFPVSGGGPFFDLDNVEANLTVTASDSDGNSVSRTLRVRLGFDQPADLPD